MIIVWGFRTIETLDHEGSFFCSKCRSQEGYRRVGVQRYLVVFWVPVFPVSGREDVVVCKACGERFTPEVLTRDTRAARAELHARVQDALRGLLIGMAHAGRRPDHACDAVLKAWATYGEGELGRSTLLADLEPSRAAKFTPILCTIGLPRLSDAERHHLLAAVAAMTPSPNEDQRAYLRAVEVALGGAG